MVDVNLLVREYLLSQLSVTTLLGGNANGSIYASSDLPEKFDPKLGPAIQLFRSGGLSHEEIPAVMTARLQLRTWADVGKKKVAADVYGAVHDVLHGTCGVTLSGGTLMSMLEVTGPQEMTDPDTGWVSVNSFYTVMARPS